MIEKIIQCKDLLKIYNHKPIVNHLSFSVGKGEVFGLLGSNGAGKTTTIKMILGLTAPTEGKINIKKEASIGYSPETPYFHPFLTGFEVMEFFSKLQKIDKNKAQKEIEEILFRVGLKEASKCKVKTYSKGMLQRLAVAQALLGNPEILIFDEPASGLDALGRRQILDLICQLKSDDKTIILNSHILSDVQKTADRILIMDKGVKVKELDLNKEKIDKNLEEIFIETLGGIEDDSHYNKYL